MTNVARVLSQLRRYERITADDINLATGLPTKTAHAILCVLVKRQQAERVGKMPRIYDGRPGRGWTVFKAVARG